MNRENSERMEFIGVLMKHLPDMVETFIENFDVKCNNKLGNVIFNIVGLWDKKKKSDNKEVA